MTTGERLRSLRLERGIALNEMAEAVGMTPQGYIRLEQDEVGKTFAKIPMIAKKLGCSTDALFPEMDPPAPEEPEPVQEDDDDQIPF